jgi:hypothetical protein
MQEELENIFGDTPPKGFTEAEWKDGYISQKDAYINCLCKASTIKDAAVKHFRRRELKIPGDQRGRAYYGLREVYLYSIYRNKGPWLGKLEDGIVPEIETEVSSDYNNGSTKSKKKKESENLVIIAQKNEALEGVVKMLTANSELTTEHKNAFNNMTVAFNDNTKALKDQTALMAELALKKSSNKTRMGGVAILALISAGVGFWITNSNETLSDAVKESHSEQIKMLTDELKTTRKEAVELADKRHKESLKEAEAIKQKLDEPKGVLGWFSKFKAGRSR